MEARKALELLRKLVVAKRAAKARKELGFLEDLWYLSSLLVLAWVVAVYSLFKCFLLIQLLGLRTRLPIVHRPH